MSNSERPYNMSDKRNKSFPQDYPASRADSATTSNIAMGVMGDEAESEYSGDGSETEQGAETLRADWPLPLGTLTLDHRVKH